MYCFNEVDINEVSDLYNRFIVPYFHPDEVKPLAIIKSMMNLGLYRVITLGVNDSIVAVAFLVYSNNKTAILLDYFSVDENCRSMGYGSVLLSYISENITASVPMIIETESMNESISSEELLHRKKRNNFYLKNGVVKTSETALIFGCLYDIWYLCIDKKSDLEIIELYDEIYRSMIPGNMYKENCFIPYK